jgi:hypothetical protein
MAKGTGLTEVEKLAHLLREAEPGLSRQGDLILLECPDGTITDELFDVLEAVITSRAALAERGGAE